MPFDSTCSSHNRPSVKEKGTAMLHLAPSRSQPPLLPRVYNSEQMCWSYAAVIEMGAALA